MAVYNGERHVRESVESILAQTVDDFEFLIVDDGSSDDSLEILRGLAAVDARIHVIESKSNGGLTRSLNIAMEQARGEFIARQDADDIALPARFEFQLRVFDKNSDYDIVGTNYCFIDVNGAAIDQGFRSHFREDTLDAFTRGLNPLCHSCVMFRRNVVEAVGGYDESYRYAQDYELWLRAISNSHKTHNIPQTLHKVRRYTAEAARDVAAPALHAKERLPRLKCIIRIQLKYLKRYWYSPRYVGAFVAQCIRFVLPAPVRSLLSGRK